MRHDTARSLGGPAIHTIHISNEYQHCPDMAEQEFQIVGINVTLMFLLPNSSISRQIADFYDIIIVCHVLYRVRAFYPHYPYRWVM